MTNTRQQDRAECKEELRASNPHFTDTQLESALNDLDAAERFLHPERFIPQVSDAVEYIDPESGWHHVGTVLAIDFGSRWSEPRVQVRWEDMQPTWVRASTLRQLC